MTQEHAIATLYAATSAPDGRPARPAVGDKGDFRKVTATLPPALYGKLIQESARRKMAGKPNQLVSSILREAISDYLRKLEQAG